MPNQLFNVDQTPMPFVINAKHTYEEIQKNHQKMIWISHSRSDNVQWTMYNANAKGEQQRENSQE